MKLTLTEAKIKYRRILRNLKVAIERFKDGELARNFNRKDRQKYIAFCKQHGYIEYWEWWKLNHNREQIISNLNQLNNNI